MERKSISKKLRFEVYKRDSFTCQYCGRKAPDVALNVDHVVPVSKGGTNDILNLITSCFDCNNGKRDIPLNEENVLGKQRVQLEQLQERREQIEMMFEWKKSLENLDDYTTDLLTEYVESKITPYTLNETGLRKLSALLRKHDIKDVFDAIDQGVKSYLKYDMNGLLTQESVNTFLNKLGGIATYQKMSPVEQKMHYIKGICRNRFVYWNDKIGIGILRSYINALREYGWTDDNILSDLETKVTDLAKSARNWSEWRERMEGWTESIREWDKESSTNDYTESSVQIEEIIEISDEVFDEILKLFELMDYLSVPFGFQNVDRVLILYAMQKYINDQISALLSRDDIESFTPDYRICNKLHLFDTYKGYDSDLKFMINYAFTDFAINWTEENLYLPSHGLNNVKDATVFKHNFDKHVNNVISK